MSAVIVDLYAAQNAALQAKRANVDPHAAVARVARAAALGHDQRAVARELAERARRDRCGGPWAGDRA